MEIADDLVRRIITTLDLMITDWTHRFDEIKGDLEVGSCSDYSPELKEAIEVRDTLKEMVGVQDLPPINPFYVHTEGSEKTV